MSTNQPNPREVGILFRGNMVRAILAKEKWETRRPIRNRDGWHLANPSEGQHGATIGCYHTAEPHFYAERDITSRWAPGDRLWVRETWRPWIRGWSSHVQYRADGARGASLGQAETTACIEIAKKNGGVWDTGRAQNPADVNWRPSLLMPRWACRITLPVLTVRAERLTAITDAGTVAEGFVHAGLGATAADYCREYRKMYGLAEDADPWVWVIAFGAAEAPHA